MKTLQLRRALAALAFVVPALLAGCGGGSGEQAVEPPPPPPPPALETVTIVRQFQLGGFRGAGRDYVRLRGQINNSFWSPGEFHEGLQIGGLTVLPEGRTAPNGSLSQAQLSVTSNASGFTYTAVAEAPSASPIEDLVGGHTHFIQTQQFRKRSDAAKLRYVVSKLSIVMIDGNPQQITPEECPQLRQSVPVNACRMTMTASVDFELDAFTFKANAQGRPVLTRLKKVNGLVWAWGWSGNWIGDTTWHDGERMAERWNFDFSYLADPQSSRNDVVLQVPIVIEIPVDQVPLHDDVVIVAQLKVEAFNHRKRESFVGAFFRDPAAAEGSGDEPNRVEMSGFEPVRVSEELASMPVPAVEDPTPVCSGAAAAAAGTVEFERASYGAAELPGPGGLVTLVRRGGSAGEASVRLRTSDGTALAGKDYVPLDLRVRFRDGETSRTVRVPMVLDAEPEPGEELALEISEPRGCAVIGSQTRAVLGIADDDNPVQPEPVFTVSGTVDGLAGSGLVLEDRAQFIDLPIAADGSFTFAQPYAVGAAYDVRVKSPPTAPAQVCAVERGQGTISDNVTDVLVRCETPPPPGALDTGFGTLGKVATGLLGGARAIARQSTGHIIATHGTRMARFTPDGRLDTTFGGGAGYVDNLLNQTGGEVADIVVLSDDRIVVAGRVLQPGKSAPYYQMAAARFFADGSRDTGFGSGGLATPRLAGIGEHATRVLAQPDSRLVLVGQATRQPSPSDPFNNDIALVRLNANGSLDTSFGTGGAVIADAMLRDFAFAALLQSDGRIVVGGRTSNDNALSTDSVFTRIALDGAIEPGFGRNPAYSALDDEIVDAALQPDGKIVLLVAAKGINMEILLARINSDGSPDTTFGSNGVVRGDIGPHDDLPRAVALQADGKIVVAAQLSAATGSPNFGLLRYLVDGTLDAGFGSGGVMRVDFFGGLDSANDLLVQPDGRIVAAGAARSGLSADIAMVRINP